MDPPWADGPDHLDLEHEMNTSRPMDPERFEMYAQRATTGMYVEAVRSIDGTWCRYFDPAIVAAMAIAHAAREAGLVDEHGNPLRIVGTLPVTADGCVVGNHVVSVYYIDKRGKVRESLMLNRSFREPVYSTRSAAEAAKGGGDA